MCFLKSVFFKVPILFKYSPAVVHSIKELETGFRPFGKTQSVIIGNVVKPFDFREL